MTVTFLGTSAAHSHPLPFCNCRVCVQARKTGGKDFRKRSSILINDDLIIDLGQDFMSASCMYGVDTSKIRYWLQTHSHSDHFSPAHIITRTQGYASENVKLLSLYASAQCIQHISDQLGKEEFGANLIETEWLNQLNMEVTSVKHGEQYMCGHYTVTALDSNHDADDGSFFYVVNDNSRNLFYGLDADEPTLIKETMDYFSDNTIRLDIAVIDHTYGDTVSNDHLNTKQFTGVVNEMKKRGIINQDTLVFASHISHEGTLPHDEFEVYAKRRGYNVAYDGLIVEV